MVKFKTEKVTERVTRIIAPCTEMMYLIEGGERAALIDTGSGFGDLRTVVEGLTDKEVIVLLTHGHVDHAMGSAQFDTVYWNPEDAYIYGPHGDKQFRMEGAEHAPVPEKPTEEDYIPTAPVSHYKPMKEGDVFDLGGVKVVVYACPGHTKGSMVMLIPEEKILITGDACNEATFMFEDYSTTIVEYQKNLEALLPKIAGCYDRVLTSHHSGEVNPDVIESVIQVCEDIQNGNTDDIPLPFKGCRGLNAKAIDFSNLRRLDGGTGNIVYSKARIR